MFNKALIAKAKASPRQLKVGEAIKEILVGVFIKGKKLHPDLIDARVTVSAVTLSPDLKMATCYVLNFFGSRLSEKSLLEALEYSKYEIRKMVTAKLQLKYSPELRFRYDHSFDAAHYSSMQKTSE